MSLAQIKRKQLIENKLDGLRASKTKLETREKELNEKIDAATELDELDAVKTEVDEVEESKDAIDSEIKELEDELEEIDENLENEEEKKTNAKVIKTKQRGNDMENLVTRKGYEYLNLPEVRTFYENVEKVMKKRAIEGLDLAVPEVVVNRIESKIDGYSKLIGEVDLIDLNGTGRVLVAGDIPEALWLECCDALQEITDNLSQVEIDCYKVGGFVPVCNAMLEDSFIALANFIEDRLAKAIAKAVDNAIVNGDGVKKPTGATATATKVTVTSIKELLAATADANTDGDVIIVANRKTLKGIIYPEMILPTSDGRYAIAQNDLLGFKFVRSDSVAAGHALIGDFKKYMLGRRKGVTLARSEHAKFVEDQTLFKATARYDGKPVVNDAFVDVTLNFGATGVEGQSLSLSEPSTVAELKAWLDERDITYSPDALKADLQELYEANK